VVKHLDLFLCLPVPRLATAWLNTQAAPLPKMPIFTVLLRRFPVCSGHSFCFSSCSRFPLHLGESTVILFYRDADGVWRPFLCLLWGFYGFCSGGCLGGGGFCGWRRGGLVGVVKL